MSYFRNVEGIPGLDQPMAGGMQGGGRGIYLPGMMRGGQDSFSKAGGEKKGFSLFRALGNFFKGGVIDTLKGMFSLNGLLMAGGSIAAVALLGPAVVPFLIGGGLVMGGFQLGKGVLTAASKYAEGDNEGAENAFREIGSGAMATGLSLFGLRNVYKGTNAVTVPGKGGGKPLTAAQASKEGYGSTLKFFVKDMMGKTRYNGGKMNFYEYSWSSVKDNWKLARQNGILTTMKKNLLPSAESGTGKREIIQKQFNREVEAGFKTQYEAFRAKNPSYKKTFEEWLVNKQKWVEGEMIGPKGSKTLQLKRDESGALKLTTDGQTKGISGIKDGIFAKFNRNQLDAAYQAYVEEFALLREAGVKGFKGKDPVSFENWSKTFGTIDKSGQFVFKTGGQDALFTQMRRTQLEAYFLEKYNATPAGQANPIGSLKEKAFTDWLAKNTTSKFGKQYERVFGSKPDTAYIDSLMKSNAEAFPIVDPTKLVFKKGTFLSGANADQQILLAQRLANGPSWMDRFGISNVKKWFGLDAGLNSAVTMGGGMSGNGEGDLFFRQ